ILLYVSAMWTSGITQGVMLNATNEHGTVLAYPNFLDTINAIRPMMLMRLIGGALYLAGWLMLAYNLYRTVRGAQPVNGAIEAFADEPPAHEPAHGLLGGLLGAPVVFCALGLGFACAWLFGRNLVMLFGLFGMLTCGVLVVAHFEARRRHWSDWYDRLLVSALPFTLLTFIAVVAGGLIQIIPTLLVNKAANVEDRRQIPYTPLELAGRDIYVREGCYLCHSQMIRMLVPDVLRYGDYSRLGESIYDHPFQWGSKRNGPDLARVGGKYPDVWHLRHFEDPRSISSGSNMPAFPWLLKNDLDTSVLPARIAALRTLGVPYPEWSDADIAGMVASQQRQIADELRAEGAYIRPGKEVVALIAYIQKLGKYESVAPRAAEVRTAQSNP
ncbi:MAG: cytochrome-c oxidase, cbb3-type subunit II, partial [Verrucomicrobiota bacterium]|nr:cytochrome-c oxidase, cbb3-type subunit II [Verrucomicrobiota bacterium]